MATTSKLYYIKAYRPDVGPVERHVVAQTIGEALANALPASYEVQEARVVQPFVLVVS
jgi:hypothetical protein